MTESKKKTKRKVDLVSSHSDDERDGPLAAHTTEGSPIDDLYNRNNSYGIPEALRYKPKPGETLVYEEIYIPDVD